MELKTMEMSPVEMAYVLVALRNYESVLLETDPDEMEDTTNDLIFIQSLIKRFNAATVQPLPAGK